MVFVLATSLSHQVFVGLSLSALGCFVLWLVFWAFHCAFHKAYLWRSKRAEIWSFASELGFLIDEEAWSATGTLEGLPFSMGFRTVRRGKSQSMNFWASLTIGPTPEGMELTNEDILSGAMRVFGSDELNLGDPEFDAAFWICGNNVEEVREYLTPERRLGLLLGMSELHGGKLKGERINSSRDFDTPLKIVSHYQSMLKHFRLLAQAYSGKVIEAPVGSTGVVFRKVRRFARFSLGMLSFLCLVTWPAPGNAGDVITGGLLVGVGFSCLAMMPNETGRVLLQSYYAFLTVVIVCLFAWAITGQFQPLQEVSEYLGITMVSSVLFVFSWGSRHYLKTLDQTGVKAPEEADGETLL
jgi:hypothetical protein